MYQKERITKISCRSPTSFDTKCDIQAVFRSNKLISIQHFNRIHNCNIPLNVIKNKSTRGFIPQHIDFVKYYVDNAGNCSERSLDNLPKIDHIARPQL